MKNTTLCYIEKDDSYLMLHRVKKEHDINHGKWIGVGGKFEPFETPEECLLREVKEETGLTLLEYRLRGIITFVQDKETEYMFLYTADSFEGELIPCDEGGTGLDSEKGNTEAEIMGGRSGISAAAGRRQRVFLHEAGL